MSANELAARTGLEGVVVAETRLCQVGPPARSSLRGLRREKNWS